VSVDSITNLGALIGFDNFQLAKFEEPYWMANWFEDIESRLSFMLYPLCVFKAVVN